MTELSRMWDGTATGDASDAPYDSLDFSEVIQTLLAEAVPTNKSGVFRGVDNVLGYTIGSGQVTIATGKALVAGRWYRNTAPVDITVPTASTGRRDRIVLRRDTAAQTVRLTRVAGVDNGSGTAPALTQNSSTWDEPLYIFNVAAGGAITLVTDNREYIPRHGDVSAEGSAAVHAYSQITGGPTGTSTPPTNAGPTRTAAPGVDTTHYAYPDHVHKVDGSLSAVKLTNDLKTGSIATDDTDMAITLESGVRYIVEVGLAFQTYGGVPAGSGANVIQISGVAAIGSNYMNVGPDPNELDAAAQWFVGTAWSSGRGGYMSGSVVVTGTGATVYLNWGSPGSYLLAGSWIKAFPITA